MAKRLNDTAGVLPLRGGDTPCPDAGGFARRCAPRPGGLVLEVNAKTGACEVRTVPGPSAGSESLRGATAYLGERIGK